VAAGGGRWDSTCARKECPQVLPAQAALAVLVREVFGNPFRPVAFRGRWRTSEVVALAKSVYRSRRSGRMPEPAGAFERAGCGNAQVLTHCRAGGKHVRGCWVVDLVLGKS
jgi:hypothetical protein